MKKPLILKICVIITMALYVFGIFPFVSCSMAKGVKTSYKQYSIFKYKDVDVLCEPYIVSKDDWLYKIFRKKGEISEKDFPGFIVIFKEINPQINNVDAIDPGNNILIPLKKVKKEDYNQSTSGNVEIPVVEFSALEEKLNLQPFIKKRKIQKGDTLSELIDKDFTDKSGKISEEGLKIFKLVNPDIKNINIIYEGADIYLPDSSIKSQSWFKDLLYDNNSANKFTTANTNNVANKNELAQKKYTNVQNKIEAHELAQLKKLSALIGGTLLNKGKMYFPDKNGSNHVLDLSASPVLENADGSKILIISGNNVNAQLLEYVQAYWKGIKTQLLSETKNELKNKIRHKDPIKIKKQYSITKEYKKVIKTLLDQTDYDYIPNAKISFTINNINLNAKFGRVIRKEKADLLINFGDVYGAALSALEKREFKIFSITSQITTIELSKQLFSNLGYTTRINPSFSTNQGEIQVMNGLYAKKSQDKIFIYLNSLNKSTLDYLKSENIRALSVINQKQNEI